MMGFPRFQPANFRRSTGVILVALTIALGAALLPVTDRAYSSALDGTVGLSPNGAQQYVAGRQAQPTPESQPPPDLPGTHIVREGETLVSIAEQYGTSVDVLQTVNQISDPGMLQVGQPLLIPGGEGEVVATIHTIQVGDTLRGLAIAYHTTPMTIAKTNRLINPYHLAAGQGLVILSYTGSAEPDEVRGTSVLVQEGDSLLTISAEYNRSPAEVLAANDLSYPATLFPGQRLRLPDEERFQFLPNPWKHLWMYPLPAIQGEAVAIYVRSMLLGQPEGFFAGQAVTFTPYEDGYVALVGLGAFTEPGVHELEIRITGSERPWPPFKQEVQILSGGYGTQYITIPVELASLLEPEVRVEDEAALSTAYTQVSDTPYWDGPFQLPVTNTVVTAGYGDSRSYNGGPIEIYHSGVDFAGGIGTPINAPAAGTVVFSDTLQLFGKALVIDHGLGIMTGYYHLSNVVVKVGEQVEVGQLIAEGGSSGLSSGPHLHWDLRVANVSVNGLKWTNEDILQEVLP